MKTNEMIRAEIEKFKLSKNSDTELELRNELLGKMMKQKQKYISCINNAICPVCAKELERIKKEDNKIVSLAPPLSDDYCKCTSCDFIMDLTKQI